MNAFDRFYTGWVQLLREGHISVHKGKDFFGRKAYIIAVWPRWEYAILRTLYDMDCVATAILLPKKHMPDIAVADPSEPTKIWVTCIEGSDGSEVLKLREKRISDILDRKDEVDVQESG